MEGRVCTPMGHAVLPGRTADGARVILPDGSEFTLAAYVRSREDMTAEFAQDISPAMCMFVADWLRAHKPTHVHKAALTAKSYFLQEAEGLSRRAKVAWAARRGDLQVTNLQHDGVIVDLPDGASVAAATASLREACSAVLGYDQPVEEKPIGEGVSDSDASDTDGE